MTVFIGLIVTALIAAVCVFIGPVTGFSLPVSAEEWQIITALRLPRVCVALLTGAALGVAGAVLQGLFRNPLADPSILGISSGAALAAVLGTLLGSSMPLTLPVPVWAVIGAIATAVAVGVLGHGRGGFWPERLLLAGVGLGALLASALMAAMTLSDGDGVRKALIWLAGDLSVADWSSVPAGCGLVVVGILLAFYRARALNALSLGEDLAHSLGYVPSRERLVLYLAVALLVAASVFMGGIVGFVGFLVPHGVRFKAGCDARILLPMSALLGGVLVCLADTLGRTIAAPMELPAGIVTSLVGAPYFLYLLTNRRRLTLPGTQT